jgi:hypothetical protein
VAEALSAFLRSGFSACRADGLARNRVMPIRVQDKSAVPPPPPNCEAVGGRYVFIVVVVMTYNGYEMMEKILGVIVILFILSTLFGNEGEDAGKGVKESGKAAENSSTAEFQADSIRAACREKSEKPENCDDADKRLRHKIQKE